MKRLLPVLLLCSLALNVLLAQKALTAQSAALSRPVARSASESAAVAVTASGNRLAGNDPASSSQSAEFAEIEARLLVAATLAAREYWRTDGQFELELGRAILDAEDNIRAELTGLFGATVATEPALRRLFRPLDPLFAFLNSDQQIAVQRLRYERDAEISRGRQSSRGAAVSGISPDLARGASERYQDALAELLDPATLFEFLLRDSALARQLRVSGVAMAEHEFRECFEILLPLEDGAAGIDAVIAARDELRRTLGDRRFAAFWASRDPLYSRLQLVAENAGVSAGSVDAVYEIVTEFQDRQMRAARLGASSPEQAARETAQLAAEERSAIARLVGDELADRILNARAVGGFRLLEDAMTSGDPASVRR
jgi:hypothetical protein